MKKLMLILMACMLVVSFSTANSAEAKGKVGGSYKAPSKSYSPTAPAKGSGVTKTDPGKSGTTAGTGTTASKPGFFGGGGFMKGMMIGGLAGLMFGGLFGGMGAFGNILGMLVNILAIVVVIMVIRRIFVYFRDRKNVTPKKRFQE